MSCNCIEPSIWALSAETSQAKVGFSCLNGEGSQKYLNFSANGNYNLFDWDQTCCPQLATRKDNYKTTKQSSYIYKVQDYGMITVYEDKKFIYNSIIDIDDWVGHEESYPEEIRYQNVTDATLTTNPPRIQCEISDPYDPLSPTVPVVISAEDVLTGPTAAGLYEAEFCTAQIINCQFVGLPPTCIPDTEVNRYAGTATPLCGDPCNRDVGCTGGKNDYYNNILQYSCRFGYNEFRRTVTISNQRGLANEVTDDFVHGICKESTTKKIEKLKTNIIDTCEPLTNPDENWSLFSGIIVKAKTIDNIPTAQKAIFRVCVPKENVKNNTKVEGKFYLYIGATCASCCVDEDNFSGTIVDTEDIVIYPNDPVMVKGGIEYFYKDVQISYDNDTYSQYAGETIDACFTLISLK